MAIETVLYIGQVISVEGRTVKVAIEKNKNLSHLLYKGKILKNVSVGNYLKIRKGYSSLIAKIESEYISEDRTNLKSNFSSHGDELLRVLHLSLVGFYENSKFKRGVSELPLIGNECFLLREEEFNNIHSFIKKGDEPITVGKLANEKAVEISIGVNGLFASHIGIFGNTGSGKSYTLAKIYNSLFNQYSDNTRFREKAKFVLIDFNGEYVDPKGKDDDNVITDVENKNIFILNTQTNKGLDKIPLGPQALDDINVWSIILEATEKTQAPFLKKALQDKYLDEIISDKTGVRLVDHLHDLILKCTTVEYKRIEPSLPNNLLYDLGLVCDKYQSDKKLSIGKLQSDFDKYLDYNSSTEGYYWRRGLKSNGEPDDIYNSKVEFKQIIEKYFQQLKINISSISVLEQNRIKILLYYYGGLIRGYINPEHIGPLIGRLESRFSELNKVLSFEDNFNQEKNFTIISLRDVNIHMRKIIPMLLCKTLYEQKKRQANSSEYLNIIIDEAHNILSSSSIRESEHWKDYRLETFEEIIKEGRKFGVFLTIASQRPSDISSTIISQIHNYFLHRLVNSNDIFAIEKTVSYLDRVSFEALSILPTGTCILAGMIADIPVTVEISEIEQKSRPFNRTIELLKYWK